MTYIELSEYTTTFGKIETELFVRISAKAARMMERYTTGIDGFNKLRKAYPEQERETIQYCAGELIRYLSCCELNESALNTAEDTSSGTHSKIITSVSAGNEAVSYATVTGVSRLEQEQTCARIIREYLTGIQDANGVYLLYMGAYPHKSYKM